MYPVMESCHHSLSPITWIIHAMKIHTNTAAKVTNDHISLLIRHMAVPGYHTYYNSLTREHMTGEIWTWQPSSAWRHCDTTLCCVLPLESSPKRSNGNQKAFYLPSCSIDVYVILDYDHDFCCTTFQLKDNHFCRHMEDPKGWQWYHHHDTSTTTLSMSKSIGKIESQIVFMSICWWCWYYNGCYDWCWCWWWMDWSRSSICTMYAEISNWH